MNIETKSTHINRAAGNVFIDLGFEPAEAAILYVESQKIIEKKFATKADFPVRNSRSAGK